MKILMISNFHDNSGWSFAAQSYALAMDRVGLDVVLRNIKLNNVNGEVHPRIVELEQKSDKNCDVVIQKVLPHMMSYNGNFKKNIGLFVCETDYFGNSSWPSYLNTMDEIIVPSLSCKEACVNSKVSRLVHVVPEPYNQEEFEKGYEPLDLGLPENSFNFYFIGENIKRKNIRGLVEAFHLEFAPWEPVNLVLKTSMYGVPEDKQEGAIQDFLKQIKYELKLYHDLNKYAGEIVILGRLSNEDIMRLHASCHCYVAPSFGEGWNRPCFDALAFGNPILATEGTGMDEYLPSEFSIRANSAYAIGNTDCFGELCVANERWSQIDLEHLRDMMRTVYNHYKHYKDIALNVDLSRFTLEGVGKKIKEIVEK